MKLKNIIDSFSSFNTKECHAIWGEVSEPVQIKKLDQAGIASPDLRNQILDQLKVRPALLSHIAKEIFSLRGRCNFLEVGTAEGLQSITIAKTVVGSKVFTCDIRDVRHTSFHELTNASFTLGDSKKLASEVTDNIDMCWIDGAHDHYSVVSDFLSVLSLTDKETIWIFDDFDKRFGCWYDISVILQNFEENCILELGSTASGNPSAIALGIGFKK